MMEPYFQWDTVKWIHAVPVVSNGSSVAGDDRVVAHGAAAVLGEAEGDPVLAVVGAFKLAFHLEPGPAKPEIPPD